MSTTPTTPQWAIEAAKELFKQSNLEESCFAEEDADECRDLFARIITRHAAPHLSQREPGDSELLDWLETTRRALFTRDSSGVVKFDAETSATDWHCVNAPTFRQAIRAAMRGEGKP